MQTPDHERGVAFCNLTAELEVDSFGPFLAALKRAHGENGVAGAAAALSRRGGAASAQGLLFAFQALHGLGSPSANDLFPVVLRALGCAPGSPWVDDAAAMTDAETFFTLPNALPAPASAGLCAAFSLQVRGLIREGRVFEAAACFSHGVRSGAGLVEEAMLLIRDLLVLLDAAAPKPPPGGAAPARPPSHALALRLVSQLLRYSGARNAALPSTVSFVINAFLRHGRVDEALELARDLLGGSTRKLVSQQEA